MMPIVTRTRRRPWISPDIAGLLLCGWGHEERVEVGDRRVQPRALLRRQPVEDADETDGGRGDDAIDLDLAGRGDRDEDRAPIRRIGIASHVAIVDEALD